MNYIDYIIIGFIIFYALWGLSKGLLKIIFDLAGYIAAFFAAKLLSPALVDILKETQLSTVIQNQLYDTFNKLSPTLTRSIETVKIPENITELINSEPGLSKIFESYPKLFDSLQANIIKLSGQGFLESITGYILSIIAVLLIFIVVKVIISIIVSIILSRHDDLPLAFVNRLLGLVFGLVSAFILLSFAFQLGEIYALTTSPVLSNAIAHSQFGYLFTSVPILEWLSTIF